MTSINPVGNPYTQYPQTGTPQYYPGAGAPVPGYQGDGYSASPYATGYMTGATSMVGTAQGMTGLAGGLSSMTSTVGGIFGGIIDLIAGILNAIVNLVVNVIEGILGLFGVGKKDKPPATGPGMNPGGAPVPLPNNQGQGVMSPAGTPVPPPPPGTDVQSAYAIVDGDTKHIQDPNQGIQLIDIHAQKAKDYRDKAEQFAKEAEKEARQAVYLAEDLQKRFDQAKLAQLTQHKSKAMELLKTAQEYTKAVYDEALYAQAVNDIVNGRTGGALGSKGSQKVSEAWKNWIGGTVEKKWFGLVKNKVEAAPEVFMKSMNAVNANIGRATQVLNTLGAAAG